MKSILLVCSAGMSTSLLVTKMEKAALEKQLDITILAVAEAEASHHYDQTNIVLLGPQVRFLKSKIEKQLAGKNIPVQVIDSIDYGTMNGEAVLTKALQIMA
ncbi:PTS sugar transporter subunit IIB [Bacillus chungangensis]|uniref:PTS system cellobiose-specific IIB component n=1 Tax=Bacillus chungangensis TaxID=587633 RepID=A0ABT9WS70_9BACI|nr:PTS sugar transporter subunit IIB [Bacillus chungangensis]MDQ0175575.1 PTS system cellobiose-specific IIB component [Bacillus chungangensis]